jgi:hypothetical protein
MRTALLIPWFFATALGTTEAVAALRPIPVSNPRAGETVLAGESFEIARSSAFVAPPGARGTIREWEVFLSLDSGRSFPIRLTPHLDDSIWRATVRIPNFATGEARLLVRFGDEREEHEVEVPGTFRIQASDSPALETAFAIAAPRLGARRDSGDVPLPGTLRIVAWVEASSDGGWHWVTTSGDSWSDTETSRLTPTEAAEAAGESDAGTPSVRAIVTASLDVPPVRTRQTVFPRPAFGRTSERLSLLRRRNE